MRWGNAKFGENLLAVVEHQNQTFTFDQPLDTLLAQGIPHHIHTAEDIKKLGGHPTDLTFNTLTFAAPVLKPGKILCIGLNYTDHAQEVGAQIPEYPTIFTKYSNALIGPTDPITLPKESTKIDWEAELCVVIGTQTRRVPENQALNHALGYTVINDISVRDWQGRTTEWFQGKNWDNTTPTGPYIVTPDEIDPVKGLTITCTIDDETRQNGNTANMIFTPAHIISYISTFMTLEPGDLIALGTPAGVGLSIKPRKWLTPGQTVTTEIQGIGKLTNTCTQPN